ncbi:MAG TPA: hypothetical protein VHY08_11675 [Bacillota bacterium]|nr:hypothetical protein [Bacillota bacterium]
MIILGDLILEVVKEESITEANQVTEKPVENGANISDHIRQDPVKISLSATVAGDDAESIYQLLEEMRNNQAVFDYWGEQRFEPYESMAIESVSLTRNPAISNGHEIGISLKQVRVVEQKTTAVKLGKDPVTGQQAGTQPSETRNNDTQTQTVDQNSPVLSNR